MRKEKQLTPNLFPDAFLYTVDQNLRDAGCTVEMVKQFFFLQDKGKKDEQLELLFRHRKGLLEQIHRGEKQIDCLDYLIYQIQHNP